MAAEERREYVVPVNETLKLDVVVLAGSRAEAELCAKDQSCWRSSNMTDVKRSVRPGRASLVNPEDDRRRRR